MESWGYLGIFLVSVVGNASIILPVPSYLVVLASGAILNPWLVGISAGIGAAIGELTGYLLGRGSKKVIEKKYEKLLTQTKRWADRYGLFPVLVFFAATPLPDDIAGIFGGIVSYDAKKFLLATSIGKIISHVALAWAGFYGGQLVAEGSMLFTLVVAGIFMVVVANFALKRLKK